MYILQFSLWILFICSCSLSLQAEEVEQIKASAPDSEYASFPEMTDEEREAFHKELDQVIEDSELYLDELLMEMREQPFNQALYLRFLAVSQSFQVKLVLVEKFWDSPRMSHPENREILLELLDKDIIEVEDMRDFEEELH